MPFQMKCNIIWATAVLIGEYNVYRYFLYTLVTPTPPPLQQKCTNFSTTINRQKCIGCNAAKRGQYPWQVEISRNLSYICGGSLISSKLVLTAAHCVDTWTNFEIYDIILGQIDRSKEEPEKIVAKGKVNVVYFECMYILLSTLRSCVCNVYGVVCGMLI